MLWLQEHWKISNEDSGANSARLNLDSNKDFCHIMLYGDLNECNECDRDDA